MCISPTIFMIRIEINLSQMDDVVKRINGGLSKKYVFFLNLMLKIGARCLLVRGLYDSILCRSSS